MIRGSVIAQLREARRLFLPSSAGFDRGIGTINGLKDLDLLSIGMCLHSLPGIGSGRETI
jgi:hypothetical protein